MEPQADSKAPPFRAELSGELPGVLERGRGTALVVGGSCAAGATELRLSFGGEETAMVAAGLAVADPTLQGWKAVLPIPAETAIAQHSVSLLARIDGCPVVEELGNVEIVARDAQRAPAPASWSAGDNGPLVAICMATWEPDADRLRRQISSIRDQLDVRWVCVISDDCSGPEGLRALREVVGEDRRFIVSRSPRRLGFLSNFERALRMAPAEAGMIALADQDDVWRPAKTAKLVAALEADPPAQLAFGDFRLVTGDGEVLADTYWTARRERSSDLASLLIANQVTGAASIFRRELLELALPFPPDAGALYHDHWLALCALTSGGIAYVPGPTYDHIRYAEAVTVAAQVRAAGELPPGLRRQVLTRSRSALSRLRGGGSRADAGEAGFERYLMLLQLISVLELRLGSRLSADHRRVLKRFRSLAEGGPGTVWLGFRGLRPLLGRNETMGREHFLLAGLLWKRRSQRRARALQEGEGADRAQAE